ncbi:ExbD/TolR family protein [Mucilaginibacter ginsenosidivorans]|uniref:Biopolymer transporter ExbD n=1 Tax=Mucilaginibacter ginsenosidivorans TaxID=398053 RepID=A0A5B8UR56_9SPHI|nr:biopolymer transporter ExbD [Mucilaginibacter ginsenosidivorans]QEC61185.1 biopolymer transporter ExbD [Mucilaginibacter ginsenosidivorans]
MARIKVPRKSTAMDMTAMCDVAFLLLTFFILTAKLRTEDPLHVDVPASTVTQVVPDDNLSTLTVGQGKVFFGIEGTDIRKALLEEMGKQYKISFTPEEEQRFSVIPTFGVPMNQLKQFIGLDEEQRKTFPSPGIPVDSTANNELSTWIYQARIVTRNLKNQELRFAIKGNAKDEYPAYKKVVDVLQRQNINKFSLITSLKGK